jgi:peptidyl-prolyl cis-trans isomerase B (cyclophilin B)
VQAGNSKIDDKILERCEIQSNMKMSDEVKAKYKEVGGAPFLDGGYTVFGQVTDGMDIVDKIASTSVDRNDKPLSKISINKITVETVK